MSEASSPSEPFLVLRPEQLAVEAGGQVMFLTATQFRILAVLFSQPDRTFSRKELVERGIGTVVEERTVDVHIKEVRRKLGSHGDRLETVRGQGYRFRGLTEEARVGTSTHSTQNWLPASLRQSQTSLEPPGDAVPVALPSEAVQVGHGVGVISPAQNPDSVEQLLEVTELSTGDVVRTIAFPGKPVGGA
jgi:DNA-binding winged helix-turn-helix (wHTH) protein